MMIFEYIAASAVQLNDWAACCTTKEPVLWIRYIEVVAWWLFLLIIAFAFIFGEDIANGRITLGSRRFRK